MGKNGLLIQNLLPSKSDHCARNCRCAPEMTNQKEKNPGNESPNGKPNGKPSHPDRTAKESEKMALKDSQKRENLITRC